MAHFIDLGQDIQRLHRLLQDLQPDQPVREMRNNKGANTSVKSGGRSLRSHSNRAVAKARSSKVLQQNVQTEDVVREDWRRNDLVLRKIFGYLPIPDLMSVMLVCKEWRSIGQFQLAERTRIELMIAKLFSFMTQGREIKEYIRFDKARENWPLSPMRYHNFYMELQRDDWVRIGLPNTLSFFTGPAASEIRNLTVKGFDVEVIERLLLPNLLLKLPKIKQLKLLTPLVKTVEERGGTFSKSQWSPHYPQYLFGMERTDFNCRCSFCLEKQYGEYEIKKNNKNALVQGVVEAFNKKKRTAAFLPSRRPKTRSVTAIKSKNNVVNDAIEECFSQNPEFKTSPLESFVVDVDPLWVVPFDFLDFCPRLTHIGIIDGCKLKHRQGSPHGHYERCLKDASVHLKGKPIRVVELIFDLNSCKVQTVVDFVKDFDLRDVFYEVSGPIEEVLAMFNKLKVPTRTAGICYVFDTENVKVDDIANLTAVLHKKGYFDLKELNLDIETRRSWFLCDEYSSAYMKLHKSWNGSLILQFRHSLGDFFNGDPMHQIMEWVQRDLPKYFPTIRYVCACDPDEYSRVLMEVIGEPHQVFNINKLCAEIDILGMAWTERDNMRKRTKKNRHVHLIDMPEFRADANLPEDWCPEWTIGGDMFIFYPLENEVVEKVKDKLRGSIRVYNTRKRQARQHHLHYVKVYEGAELKDLEDTL